MLNDSQTYMNASMTAPSQPVAPKSNPRPWESNITYGSFAPDSFETENPKINQPSPYIQSSTSNTLKEEWTTNIPETLPGTGGISFQTTSTEEITVAKTPIQNTPISSNPITLPKTDTINTAQPQKISTDPSSDNNFWSNLEKNLKAVASNTDFISSAVKTGGDTTIDASKDILKEVSSLVTKDILGRQDEASKPKTKEEEEKKRKLHAFFAQHVESRKTTILQEQQKVMAVFQQKEDIRFDVAGASEEELAHSAGHQKNYKVEKSPYLRSFLFSKKQEKKKEEEAHQQTPFANNSKTSVGVDGKLRQDLANEGGILSTTGGVGAG